MIKDRGKDSQVQWKQGIPSVRANTMSLSTTVGMRWATVTTVHSRKSYRISFWMTASVVESMDAVASSSTKMRLCFNSALPKQNNCLCPTLQFPPSSVTASIHTDKLRYKHLCAQSSTGSSYAIPSMQKYICCVYMVP
jgi:hypothetical protein